MKKKALTIDQGKSLLDIDINHLPDIFELYFDTTWQGRGNFLIFFFRLITKFASKSRYEHMGTARRCPKEFDGKLYADNLKNRIVNAGEIYFFEATAHSGVIMTPLIERLANPSHGDTKWTGNIDIQTLKVKPTEQNLQKGWNDSIAQLGQPYALVPAMFSAVDKMWIIRYIKKIFNFKYKSKLTKGVFCSMFSKITTLITLDVEFNKDSMRDDTPEEVLIFLIENNFGNIAQPLVKYERGNLIIVNTDIMALPKKY